MRAARNDLHIRLVRVHAERDVGRERPGRRRPGEDIGVLPPRNCKARHAGGLLDRLIALRDFVRGERRAAAGAVRDDLVTLV